MSLLNAALEYYAAGLTVIPIALDGTKAPATKTWRKLHQKRPTEKQIRAMFKEPSGIAVLGGTTSGNLTIVDFDRPGSFEVWRELLQGIAPGLLERLPVVATPGGHHVYLRCDICEGNTKLAMAREPYEKDGKKSNTIIETRGQGGYVIAPPSPAETHPTGRLYEHLSGPPLTAIPTLTAEEYATLLSAARAFNELDPQERVQRHEPKPQAPADQAKPGEDFDARATWFEVLEPHGWEPIRTIGDKTYWRRPGKKDGGISATTGHCGTKLWVFSSNAAPFDSGRAYNKFSAYGLLNCGGDFSQASRELRAKGYGAPLPAKQRPQSSKWDELRTGLGDMERERNERPPPAPPPPDEPPPDDDIAPVITIAEIEHALDDDPGKVLADPLFSRICLLRNDDAQWMRVITALSRKKGCKQAFLGKMKRSDKEKAKRRGESWFDQLLWRENKNGEPVIDKCVLNLMIILDNDPAWRGVLALDLFSNRISLRRELPFTRTPGRWRDEDVTETRAWLERVHGVRPTSADVQEAVIAVARRNAFNPLRDYLDGLKDEHDNSALDTWLTDLFGAPDTPLTRAIGAKWMIAAIARAYDPGCKVDTVLILEGKQGLKKSRVLAQLCPSQEWFTDGLSDFGTKDQAVEIEGKWIIELAEMKGFGRELEAIKAFVSRQAENYRPPYGKNDIHSPRKCIFAATVNPEAAGYLRDATGNRRFWPIECRRQAPDISAELRDRLWAEAKARYLAGEHWWLEEQELIEAAEAEQAKRTQVDAWQELVEEQIAGHESVSTDEILAGLGVEKAKRGNGESQRVGRVLLMLKWHRRQLRLPDGRRVWRYFNPAYGEPLPDPSPHPHHRHAA